MSLSTVSLLLAFSSSTSGPNSRRLATSQTVGFIGRYGDKQHLPERPPDSLEPVLFASASPYSHPLRPHNPWSFFLKPPSLGIRGTNGDNRFCSSSTDETAIRPLPVARHPCPVGTSLERSITGSDLRYAQCTLSTKPRTQANTRPSAARHTHPLPENGAGCMASAATLLLIIPVHAHKYPFSSLRCANPTTTGTQVQLDVRLNGTDSSPYTLFVATFA